MIIVAFLAAAVGGSVFLFGSKEQATYDQAIMALDAGLSGAAVEYFTEFLIAFPDHELIPEVLFQRGTIYHLYHSQYIEATSDFRELLERYPKNKHAFETRKALAEIFELRLRNCSQAIVEYQRLIDDYPTVVEDDLYQYKIAKCFYELFQFDQAKIEIANVIEKYPSSDYVDESYYQIASVLQTQGALEEAERSYNLYIVRYPEGSLTMNARFNLAATLEEMERLDEAHEAYLSIFEEYPNKEAITWRIEKVRERLRERGR